MRDESVSYISDSNPLLGDDLILPAQFYGLKGWRTPEQELVGGQLIDAIEILTGKRAAKKYQWERDLAWLQSDATEPMDFLWVCKVLDLNHYAVREATMKRLKRFEPQRDTACRNPNVTPRTAYQLYKCRCPRCRDYKSRENVQRKINAIH